MFRNSPFSYMFIAFSFIPPAHLWQPEQDLVGHGNYQIYNCGSRVQIVKNLLDKTYDALEEAIEDLESAEPLGTTIYKTFFNGVDIDTVKEHLEAMAAGTSTWTPQLRFEKPTILCVDSRNPKVQTYLARCQANEQLRASAIRQYPIVLLCPNFFTTIPPSPSRLLCAKVVSAGSQLSHSMISSTQLTILVHEFMHVYGPSPPLQPEVYDVNSCIALSAEDSVQNPQNYAFFVGNVYAQCSQFPKFPYRGQGRRLGEGDDNDAFAGELIEPAPECASNPILVELGACS